MNWTWIILFLLLGSLTAGPPQKIVIFGAGYVGLVSGACLAKCGHKVTFVDPDRAKIELLNAKKSPISEPHLEELLAQGMKKGLIKASCVATIEDADMAIIAVQTPTTEQGTQQLCFLESVFATLNEAARKKPLIAVVRSTVLPTTIKQLQAKYLKTDMISLVVNPEFMRESTAIEDFFNPPFCVAGGNDPDSVQAVLSLYEGFCPKRFAVSLETACLLKYACNAYHASKIAFANEMASLCDSLNLDPVELMSIFAEDKMLNCSSAYLKPGFSFGGPCLSKDLKSLVSFGKECGHAMPLLGAIIPSNEERFQKVANEILQHNHRTLAVLGVSFKKNTDDLRESPFVDLIKRFQQKGIKVQVFDPDVRTLQSDLSSALEGCDGVVLCKNLLDAESKARLEKDNIPIYDLGYFYNR